MGGIMSLADNQDAEHQSGVSRFCNSIFTAICVAPIVIIICILVLGWNEKRAVCDQRALIQGEEEVQNVGCTLSSEGNGELVLFACDLQRTGLTQLTVGGDFTNRIPAANDKYVGLKISAEMLQCVETVHSETKKDQSGGGGQTTIKTYTYSVEWKTSLVDSGSFHARNSQNYQQNCGMDNPSSWPTGAPQSETKWVSSANVGAFTVPQSYLDGVPLNTALTATGSVPGWSLSGSTYTRSGTGSRDIGAMRVSFMVNDWNNPTMTVLGQNNGGTIGRWTADDSWMCSGFTVGTLRAGTVSKADLFAALHSEASATTWILRFLFLCIMWAGFCCIFKPLEVAADCIPCIGPYLGDSISCITACISCPMACACGMGVIGFMWVFMRPMVGIPLILFFCCIMGSAIGFKVYTQQQKKGDGSSANDNGPDPEAVGQNGE